jgi:alpha-amylase/alpha-mannosidase (GH57 family)
MHQPSYKDPNTGDFMLPFVRLHSAKGYYDMVKLAFEYPEMRMNVNLVPSLISQISDYAENRARDIYLELTIKPPADLTLSEKVFIIRNFFMNRWETHVYPYHRYRELLIIRGTNPDSESPKVLASRFSTRDIRDIQALFNLTWCGYFMRSQFVEIAELLKKGRDYTEDDKAIIVKLQIDVMKSLLPLYKQASDEGIIELSTSPLYHPILPLLIDTDSAKRAMPDVFLPERFSSLDDAENQIDLGLLYFEEKTGILPKGMWPSEGSVSPEIIPLLDSSNIEWTATDQDILFNSHIEGDTNPDLYSPYTATFEGSSVNIVFRDRGLSDLIGFSYAQNDPEKAIADFLKQINRIADDRAGKPTLISVILDGENPWEGYKDGGEGFLRGVYEALSKGNTSKKAISKVIGVTTIGGYLEENPPTQTIDHLHSGSWINHNYGVWIGHPEDNRAWDLVSLAKNHLIEVEKRNGDEISQEKLENARNSLYIAEGSDWFWWYGDDFHTDLTDEFDSLFRENIKNVFRLTGEEPPDALSYPISGGAKELVVSLPLGFIEPKINGTIDDYYEWADAGKYEYNPTFGSMFGGKTIVETLYYGFSLKNLYIRLNATDPSFFEEEFEVDFYLRAEKPYKLTFPLKQGADKFTLYSRIEDEGYENAGEFDTLGIDSVVEFSLPFSALELKEGDTFEFYFKITTGSIGITRCPRRGAITLQVPGENFEKTNWSV